MTFPRITDAPSSLLCLSGNCGPLSVWLLLRHFHVRVSTKDLLKQCRYTKRNGSFTVGLAIALHHYGLCVDFLSDPDPFLSKSERKLYAVAREKGLDVHPAVDVQSLLCRISDSTIAIVYFKSSSSAGHFSPAIGSDDRNVYLPYTEDGAMTISDFNIAWSADGFCRQCVLVSKLPKRC